GSDGRRIRRIGQDVERDQYLYDRVYDGRTVWRNRQYGQWRSPDCGSSNAVQFYVSTESCQRSSRWVGSDGFWRRRVFIIDPELRQIGLSGWRRQRQLQSTRCQYQCGPWVRAAGEQRTGEFYFD